MPQRQYATARRMYTMPICILWVYLYVCLYAYMYTYLLCLTETEAGGQRGEGTRREEGEDVTS